MANNMRSSIDAGEYKDFILGFIFYRFLSENEEAFLRRNDWDDEDIEGLDGESEDDVKFISERIGYFIKHDDLYSTWVDPDTDFEEKDVIDALARFPLNIDPKYKDVFDKIFETLRNSLSKLGDTAPKRSKAIADILDLIKPIPMDNKSGYDTLGFIYEYLIQNFASSAGKKAGEFYTPHEVSQMMSEIVAYELRNYSDISIYDPTSGSASLLLNIGTSIARRNGSPDSIKYYAQEKIQATYSLTRMNLVMKGIKPSNIVTNRADTLEDDWPLVNDSDTPMRVDACVSNPPYSAKWKNKGKEADPRFSEYGVAPKSKADYAFLLHNLYHMKPHGIMCIVLPHGVLFRGDAEGDIRKKLIDEGKIYAVIGLPSNIFFGTGIPTIVMVLKKTRVGDDILFIDASKGFIKDGKKNRLRSSDIRRIVDAYVAREDVEGYAHLASKAEVVENDYNLNIPRYVDSSEPAEPWDIYASMFGGVPDAELDELAEYWEALPGLREALFESIEGYSRVKVDNIAEAVASHPSVAAFEKTFAEAFDGFGDSLRAGLTRDVKHVKNVNPNTDEEKAVADVFDRVKTVPLVDRYDLYQTLDDQWGVVSGDLEMIQTEGFFEAVRKVDANMVYKTKDDKEYEEQDKKVPWLGHILPFELVQSTYFADEAAAISGYESELARLDGVIAEAFEGLDSEELEGPYIKDGNDGFDFKELEAFIAEQVDDESDEIATLVEYRDLLDAKAKKDEKLAFIAGHDEVEWSAMEPNKDGTYAKGKVNARIKEIRATYAPEPETLLARLMAAYAANEDIKTTKKLLKAASEELRDETKAWIEQVDEGDALELLRAKWVDGVDVGYKAVPGNVVATFVSKLEHLVAKYATTYAEIGESISETQSELVGLLGKLKGNDKDMAGIFELSKLLGGE